MSNASTLAASGPAIAQAPTTALGAALVRWRKRAPRQYVVLLGVCLAISLLLLALDGGRFGVKLVYSLCIGSACTVVNDLSWLGSAWAYDRVCRLRGQPANTGPYASGWVGIVACALLCLVLGPPLGQSLADFLFGFRSASLFDFSSANTRATLVISGLATLVLIAVLSSAERLATARAQAEAAQRLAAENQLRLLQSQLEPHMLFNTLANLRVLIGLDPSRAQAMLDRLIAFLRATLNASRTPLHPLSSEFQHLDDYLALMAVRMGPRLSMKLDLPADLATVQVPPLLLQPLVENCIKHGLEPKVEGGRIEVRRARWAVTCTCRCVTPVSA